MYFVSQINVRLRLFLVARQLRRYQSFCGLAEVAVLTFRNLSCRFFSCCSRAFSFSSASCLVSLEGWGFGYSAFFLRLWAYLFLFAFIVFRFFFLPFYLYPLSFAVPVAAVMPFADSAGHLQSCGFSFNAFL